MNMIAGAGRVFWVFQKRLIYWDFQEQLSIGFTENGPKKRQNIQWAAVPWANMSEIRGEWPDWFEMIERQELNNHSLQLRHAKKHL